jgi:hypothetical protein
MNQNLGELVQALNATPSDEDNSPLLSDDLRNLIESGLHPQDIPQSLNAGPAEAFVQAFHSIGGLPRLILFADRNPAAFYKLFARLLIQTSAPITPITSDVAAQAAQQWPDWLTNRRLAYQEAGFNVADEQKDAEDQDAA